MNEKNPVRDLANNYLTSLLHGGVTDKEIKAKYLISDGRKLKGEWNALIKAGYLTKTLGEFVHDKTTGKVTGDDAAFITSKAWDEVPAEPLVLADLYKYDSYDSDKGQVWVVWDRLSFGQKKAVVLAIQADPTAYTLLAVEDRYNPPKVEQFALGGAGDAIDRLGGWGSLRYLAVTDATVRAKDKAEKRAARKKNAAESGLNWFLQKTKVLDAEEEVPINERQPFLGANPAMNREPENWEASLRSTMQRTADDIVAARARLASMKKLEEYIERVGGWKVFLADYDAAVEKYIDAKMSEETA